MADALPELSWTSPRYEIKVYTYEPRQRLSERRRPRLQGREASRPGGMGPAPRPDHHRHDRQRGADNEGQAVTSDDDEMITFFAKAVKVCKTVMPPDCSVFGLVAFLGNAWLLEVKPPAYDCSPEEMMAFLAKVFDGWYVIVAALTLEEGDPDAFKMFALKRIPVTLKHILRA